MTRPIEIGEVSSMLAARIQSLCHELLPAGVQDGQEWRVGSVAGEPGRSMGVHLSGPRAGVWCDWAAADRMRGDALDLVAQVLFRGDKRQALAWARGWLGIDAVDPATLQQRRRQAEEIRKRAEIAADQQEKAKRRAAREIFFNAWPRLAGTAAERYLLGRGLDLRELPRQPSSLRYVPRLWNEESQTTWPALVAAIAGRSGDVVAVHRTWLEVRRDGSVMKAPLRDPKLTLGRYAGGAVRLWRGATGKPWAEAPPDEWLMVSEGLEDGLTAVLAQVALGEPSLRCAVGVSLGNIQVMALPPVKGVIFLEQNDPPGSQAAAAAERAVQHFREQGLWVQRRKPPEGTKDVNELLTA